MKAWDFDAVVYDGEVLCKECLPDGVSVYSDEVSPIFADQEWDFAPSCANCETVHDYMTLLFPTEGEQI